MLRPLPSIRRSLLLLPVLVVACDAPHSTSLGTTPSVARVEIILPADSLPLGTALAAALRATDAAGVPLATRGAEWQSSAPTVAAVSDFGVISPLSLGATTITATIDGKSGSATVRVVPSPIASVTLQFSSVTIGPGQTGVVTATVRNAIGETLARTPIYTTSNALVADVSAAGVVTAKAAGITTITGTVGVVSGTVLVNVVQK